MEVEIIKKLDLLPQLQEVMEAFCRQSVEVGIFTDDDASEERKNEQITNSQVGYAIEFGAPENGQIAHPFLVPGTTNFILGTNFSVLSIVVTP